MAKRILIIEDEPELLFILDEFLQSQGHHVFSASNGQEGLNILESKEIINLIITDLKMPVMDGFAFITEQRNNPDWATIPLIVLSGESCPKDILNKFPISAFLNKPMRREEIIKAIVKLT